MLERVNLVDTDLYIYLVMFISSIFERLIETWLRA